MNLIWLYLFLCLQALHVGCANSSQQVVHSTDLNGDLAQCDLGSAKACYSLARRYLRTDVVTHRRALKAFRQSCELDHAEGCFEEGKLLLRTHAGGGEKERRIAKALTLFERGCELGSLNGCNVWAKQAFMTATSLLELRRAHRRLASTCRFGHVNACLNVLRTHLILGEVVPPYVGRSVHRHCQDSSGLMTRDDRSCLQFRRLSCRQSPSSDACRKQDVDASLIDDPTCAETEQPWLAAYIDTVVKGCEVQPEGTITLRFDHAGKLVKSPSLTMLGECVSSGLATMETLPPLTRSGCKLQLRY